MKAFMICIMWLLLPTQVLAQDSSAYEPYLISAHDFPDGWNMVIKNVYLTSAWPIAPGIREYGVRQNWEDGNDEDHDISITYLLVNNFDTPHQAVNYHITQVAALYSFGAFDGSMIGDFTISSGVSSILFCKNNIAVHVNSQSPDDYKIEEMAPVVLHIARRIESKIEAYPQHWVDERLDEAEKSRISYSDFSTLVDDFSGQDMLSDYSSTEISPTMYEESSVVMPGYRVMFSAPDGRKTGIKIYQAPDASTAHTFVESKTNGIKSWFNDQVFPSFIPFFESVSTKSLDSLIADWAVSYRSKMMINGISRVDTIAYHIFHYNPVGADTEAFKNICIDIGECIESF